MVEVNHNYVVSGVQTDDLVVSGKYGNADIQGILTGSVIVMEPAKFAVNGIMHVIFWSKRELQPKSVERWMHP